MKSNNIYEETKNNKNEIFTPKKNKVSMVDISSKKLTNRTAKASFKINFSEKSFIKIINNNSPKGEIFNIARSAGISATKNSRIDS